MIIVIIEWKKRKMTFSWFMPTRMSISLKMSSLSPACTQYNHSDNRMKETHVLMVHAHQDVNLLEDVLPVTSRHQAC